MTPDSTAPQLTPAGDPTLAELVRRLVEAYQPARIYLFGSRAAGQAGPDSDYDLMVVVPDDAPPERRRSRLAYQALRGTGVAADVLVWTATEFAWKFRYPGEAYDPSPTEAREALGLARLAFDAVLSHLPSETNP